MNVNKLEQLANYSFGSPDNPDEYARMQLPMSSDFYSLQKSSKKQFCVLLVFVPYSENEMGWKFKDVEVKEFV
jgi:hypothetical protein